MIFYFTGTGNSRWVAKNLGGVFDEPLLSIAEELKQNKSELRYSLKEGEKVIFVYPVHSWGPAVMVLEFISLLKLEGYKQHPVYSVCTCGDDCGHTSDIVNKKLRSRGLKHTAAFSVQMPNNYILLPGFDIDPEKVEQEKLVNAPARLSAIVDAINHQHEGSLYHAGSAAFCKSYLIYPLFTKFALGSNAFYATDACVSCGLCERICPTNTISMQKGCKPQWSDSCVQCLACIHRCPVKAIEYGEATLKKGRYHHPEI